MTRPFPDVVRLEPYGGNCNLRCRHCPTGVNGGRRGLMKFSTFVTLFNRLPHVPRVAVFYHSSEPLINKELELMLEYAKGKGVQKTVLNTNALLLRPLPHLDEMRVSFDGTSPAENDSIRLGANFKQQAPKVLELAQRQKIVIYNAQITAGEKPDPALYLTEYFGDSVEYRTVPMRLWADQDKSIADVAEKPTGVRYCENLFETFTILSDGTVPKCCEDLQGDFLYGNALKEMPIDIWNRMERIREDFAKGNYPDLCAKCWVVGGRYVK